MTKKHFEQVASIFWAYDPPTTEERNLLESVANDLAHMFAQENPRFDRERFLKACGFGENEPDVDEDWSDERKQTDDPDYDEAVRQEQERR